MGREMVRNSAIFSLAVAAFLGGFAMLASLEARPSGKKMCKEDHWHHGSSGLHPRQNSAKAEAIRAWASWTDFEYGGAWANFRYSANSSVKCAKEDGMWRCNVEGRPCRRT